MSLTHRLYGSWNSPGQNTGVGSLSLLQGIFPTQKLNLGLLCCRWILYQLSYQGTPYVIKVSHQENLNNTYNLAGRRQRTIKKILTRDTSQKKIYKCPINAWNNAQHLLSSGRCIFKPLHTTELSKNKDWHHQVWWEFEATRTLRYHCWDCKWNNHLRKQNISYKAQHMNFLYDPAIPLLGIEPREMKMYDSTKIWTWIIKATSLIIAKNCKQSECLQSGKWINKL